MKKFSFKLQNVLRLREFEEYKEKVKLGKINQEISSIDENLRDLSEDMTKVYKAQENNLKKKVQAKDVYLYEYWIRSLRGHIVQLETKKNNLKNEYEEQLALMLKQRNKVKVIESLKEKAEKNYNKEKLKDEDKKLDYLISLSHSYRDETNK